MAKFKSAGIVSGFFLSVIELSEYEVEMGNMKKNISMISGNILFYVMYAVFKS